VRTAAIAAVLALAVLAACGGDPEPRPSGWMDVAGMVCGDGSPTGIAILPGSADAVLVYLAGGGACWSEAECEVLTRGPFGRDEFEFLQLFAGGTIFDRSLAGNPFATWTIVFVPYCTGDVHLGDIVKDHGGAAGSWQHRGYRNLVAAVDRIAADVPRPAQVVVAGSSAGGFGALVAHDLVRLRWEATGPDPVAAALVDDSGPTFVGTTAASEAWWDAWGLGSTLGAHCSGCREDFAEVWQELRDRHGGDRLAFVSTTADLEMRGRLGDMSPEAYSAALDGLTDRIEQVGGGVFRVTGDDHALLVSAPWSYSAGGTTLLGWLSGFAAGDPGWGSVGP
jgi:hypothetical protein